MMLSDAAKARALRRGPGFLGFLLAHHLPGGLEHCYQLWLWDKPLWICARCLGLYPTLLAALAIQFAIPVKTDWYDIPWLFIAPIPAMLDWISSRLGPWRGNNWVRTGTGSLLGVSLSRTVYLNIQDPWQTLILLQLGYFLLIVGGVELLARFRTWPGHAPSIHGTKKGIDKTDPEVRSFEQ